MTDRIMKNVRRIFKNHGIFEKVEEYIENCGADKFPNMAGFCRFLEIGQGEFEEIGKDYPYEYDALCSIFEDEALNSRVAVTLVGAYMKKRLGYGDEKKASEDPITVYFEHDIMKDGK